MDKHSPSGCLQVSIIQSVVQVFEGIRGVMDVSKPPVGLKSH